MSAKDALEKFCERDAREVSRVKRTNKKPEFEFRKKVMRWLIERGFECDVVESKGVYNFEAGRYDHGQTKAGFSDVVGVTPYFGVACYLELKAPGRRSMLKNHQKEFLIKKINKGAFAVCVDAIEDLEMIYLNWRHLRSEHGYKDAIEYLIGRLPKGQSAPRDGLLDLISTNDQSPPR